MRPIFVVGLAVLVLGIFSFVIPFPHSETHGAKIGDANIGITTHSSKTLPPLVGGILVAAGVILIIAGSRKGA